MRLRRNKDKRVCLNTAAGAIGRLAGSWTMDLFQAALEKLKPAQPPQQSGAEEEPAPVKTAKRIAGMVGRELTPAQKKVAAPLVHYGFGTLTGAIYGALGTKAPVTKTGAGAAYGAVVWLLADEVAVPAAGLAAAPPSEVPWTSHIQYLAAHLVYGVTVECARRLAIKMS